MNKKLLIFIFLLMAAPVFADDMPYVDEIVEEQAPTLEQVNVEAYSQPSKFTTFKEKLKNAVPKFHKNKINSAEEVNADEPSEKDIKTIDGVLKEQKAKKKALKKDSKTNDIAAVTMNNLVANASDEPLPNEIIQVDECVKLALEHHPVIKSAYSNTEIYKSKIGQAWANYFPTIAAGISLSKNNPQIISGGASNKTYDMYYVPNISGSMLLFDFGKTKAVADIAKRTYEASEFGLQHSIHNVVFAVKQAYYNLLFAQQQVKVYEDTVNDYTLHLEQAKAYYDIGTKAKIDVLTAEYNLGRAKLNLIQAKNTLNIAYVQLSNAMGLPDYTDYGVVDNLTTKAYSIGMDEAVDTAYKSSPELLAAEKKAEASKILISASKRAYTPDLSGFAGYTRGGSKIDYDNGYQFGAQLNYSAFNLLLLKKQVDEAKATYQKDVADFENTKQTIYFDVKEAYLQMTTAQESIAVAKLAMDQAKEQYDQASGRYKVGLGDAIELKDAETTYRNSQLDYYNTLLNYHVSAANLERIMGVPLNSSDLDLL